jgi:hypothetical protein
MNEANLLPPFQKKTVNLCREREEEKGKISVLLVDFFLPRFKTSSELKN